MSASIRSKLAALRRLRGLTQKEAAERSGVGVKTISSFETGVRIDQLKVTQLIRLLLVYRVTPAEFFGGAVEKMAPWEISDPVYRVSRRKAGGE